MLTAVAFDGDFLGALPAAQLAQRLAGVRFERAALRETLDAAEVEKYFDGVGSDQLLDLLLGR